MVLGQIVMALAGAFAVVVGLRLLLRPPPLLEDKRSEARLPAVTLSGPPGLMLAVVGLGLIVFPFSPWWPVSSPPTAPAVATPQTISMEAEDGDWEAPLVPGADEFASGGGYVASAESEEGSVRLEFFVADGGSYVIWGRVATAPPPAHPLSSDSFHVSMDRQAADIWDLFEAGDIGPGPGWRWDRVSLRCGGDHDTHGCDPQTFNLSPGRHYLVFRTREPGARLDSVRITNEGFTPG